MYVFKTAAAAVEWHKQGTNHGHMKAIWAECNPGRRIVVGDEEQLCPGHDFYEVSQTELDEIATNEA